jgi:hypothetical protein
MFRKALVIPALLLALTACGGARETANVGSRTTASVSASAAAMSPTAGASSCPTAATKKFAKTRFVADLGLAFGAFHRYILKPYQAGTFKPGAGGRTKALIKGAAAGAFALNRLNAARRLVNDDPTLCKRLKAPLDALWTQLSTLAGKLKSGNLDPTEIAAASGTIEGVRKNADKVGMPIKDE